MAPPPQKTTVAAGKQNQLSDAALFIDKPPRLVVAINRVPGGINRTLPNETPGASVPAPEGGGDPILQACGANFVNAILEWVDLMLRQGLTEAWWTEAGKAGEFPDPEESWARKVAELFTGCAYGGPDGIANFPDWYKSLPKPAVRPMVPISYIYQRFQMKYVPPADFCTAKVLEEAPLSENTDPAYSLFVACQHLASYVLLSRGFIGEQTMYGIGVTAGSNEQLPIFQKNGGQWISYKHPTHGEMPLDANYAITTVGLIPGSVYCYDPYGAVNSFIVRARRSDLQQDEDGMLIFDKGGDPMLKRERNVPIQQASAEKPGRRDGPLSKQYGEDPEDVDNEPTFDVRVTKIQATGSHIGAVLRLDNPRMSEKPPTPEGSEEAAPPKAPLPDPPRRLQAFESAAINWVLDRTESVPWQDDPTKVTVPVMLNYNAGMFEADWGTKVYRGNHYVGVGIPPVASNLEAMTAFMGKARPVGIARMVILRKRKETYPIWPNKSDLLFLSRPMLTWGSDPHENYSPSRYLMSLRNTPYYRDIQVYWFLYAPQGKLAESMWAEEARSKSLGTFLRELKATLSEYNRAHPKNPQSLISQLTCASAITHDDHGLVKVAWRANIGGGGASDTLPGVLPYFFVQLKHYLAGALEKTQGEWEAQYVNPALVGPDGDSIQLPEMLSPIEEGAEA